MTVMNRPNDGYVYEFEVVIPIDKDIYKHIGFYTDGFIADQQSKIVNGIVIHNVRIQGKKSLNNRENFQYNNVIKRKKEVN